MSTTAIKRFVKPIIPPYLLRMYQLWGLIAKAGRGLPRYEPEASLLPLLCVRRLRALDVGGANGSYAWNLARLSRVVDVFEPNPRSARDLATGFLLNRKVRIHGVALSDEAGTATLRIPATAGALHAALATIEPANRVWDLPCEMVEVRRRRLDDYGFTDVGFIKIDVEGHELSVLKGGAKLLRDCRPNLLIEAAEQHRPRAVASIAAFLEGLGYQGVFLLNGALQDIERFDPLVHQPDASLDVKGAKQDYVADVIFVQDRAALRSAFMAEHRR